MPYIIYMGRAVRTSKQEIEMSIITSTQRAEIESMVSRYDAAVAAGRKMSDPRVTEMYNGAKYVLDIAAAESPNTAFHSMTAKQVVEQFAGMVAMQQG